MATLAYTHEHNLSSVHISLVDSYSLYDQSLPNEVFSQEVASDRPIPRNISETLSLAFVGEYVPPLTKKMLVLPHMSVLKRFLSRCLPTQWVFTRKRDGSAKARLVVCGHRQVLGKDYFEHKNSCSVLSSRR